MIVLKWWATPRKKEKTWKSLWLYQYYINQLGYLAIWFVTKNYRKCTTWGEIRLTLCLLTRDTLPGPANGVFKRERPDKTGKNQTTTSHDARKILGIIWQEREIRKGCHQGDEKFLGKTKPSPCKIKKSKQWISSSKRNLLPFRKCVIRHRKKLFYYSSFGTVWSHRSGPEIPMRIRIHTTSVPDPDSRIRTSD